MNSVCLIGKCLGKIGFTNSWLSGLSWLHVWTELEYSENSADISSVYCSHPVKHPSCHASFFPSSALSGMRPVLHPSCPVSGLVLYLYCPAYFLSGICLHLSCPASCFLLVLQWFCPTYVLSCICPVLTKANFNPQLLTRAAWALDNCLPSRQRDNVKEI